MAKKDDEEGRTRPRSRKDADGVEQVIKMESLVTRIDFLVESQMKVIDVTTQHNKDVTAVAEAAGLHTNVVKKIVKSIVDEKFAEVHGGVMQMSLAFDEVKKARGELVN
jgi:hypothetical protein